MPPVFRRRVVVQFLAPPQDFLSLKLKVYPTRRISRLFNLVPAPARAICKIMASGRKKSSVGFGRTNGARISIGFHNLRAFAPYGHGHVFDARSTVSLGCHGYFSSSLLVQTRIKVAATANIPQGDLEALARCRSEMTCGCNDISAALLSGPGIRERLVDALNPPHKEGLSFLRQLTALLSLSLAATHKDSNGLAPPRDGDQLVGDHVLAFAAPVGGAVRSTADSKGDPRRLHRSVPAIESRLLGE
jgi:hypothetical protein